MALIDDAHLRSVTEADFVNLANIAREIWLAHYVGIVTSEQVEYMLASRFTSQNLQSYLGSHQRWMELLSIDEEIVGYCSYALTAMAGEMKLEQLYLSPKLHGRGLGTFMLEHIEDHARSLGCERLVLQVNKANTSSIAVYQKRGFAVREAAQFDIGNGFIMDDYIMEKKIGRPDGSS